MYIRPREEVVIKCFPFWEKHMPVVSSPHCALQRSLPDYASKMMICLSVVEVTATWPKGSNITFKWSGTTFLFGSGRFSQNFSSVFISLKFKMRSCPVKQIELLSPFWLGLLAKSIENILFLQSWVPFSLNGSRSLTFWPCIKEYFTIFLSAPQESRVIWWLCLDLLWTYSSRKRTDVTVLWCSSII